MPKGPHPSQGNAKLRGRLKGDSRRQRRTINATEDVWQWAKAQHPQGASDYLQSLYDLAKQ